ncbi:HD domain-containing protein [Glycomyces sp. A-F 0318]|uniref:HD domain-containing protein n=1 Tax=Glycomyces amatae TaxID=2881355 RepID=UPI001E5D5583|nr:HD domain-containing protein [Glycomyces amatae]MCD0446370.1 HD domain-containing protein [Glycomyces amatae]
MTELAGTAGYLFEAGLLKRAKRTGWWVTGVKDPESIAEHSWRAAVTGMVLASLEGADPARTALLCVLHDTPETRIGDIPKLGRDYLTAADSATVVADQTAACPERVTATIQEAITEFETGETPEATCARDADRLECLIQAVEYRHQGVATVQRWIDTSFNALESATARGLAQEVLEADPLAWELLRQDPPRAANGSAHG